MFHALLFNINSKISNGRIAGIHRIATHLREQNWDIEVIDFTCFWSLENLKILCKNRLNSESKFIGFSPTFSYWSDELNLFCDWLKEKYPHLILISGSSNDPLFFSKSIDYYISGYGENAIDALLKYKFSNGPNIKLKLLSDNRKVINALHDYPAFPIRDPSIIYEDRDFINENEFLPIEFSRGCRFSCHFCNFPILGVKGDYTRNVDNFEKQLLHAYDMWGTKNYIVVDETFNDYTEKIIKYGNIVEKLPFRPWFSGGLRADLLVTRQVEKDELLRMNFLGHFYGIETFNHDSGKSIGKGMDPDKLKKGLIDHKEYFKKHGFYRATISLICGLPFESLESINTTHQWLLENWNDQVTQMNPLEIYNNELIRDSKISINYGKYGYRKIGYSVVDNGLNLGGENHLIWENDFMDYRISTDISKTISEKFRLLDNFSIGHITVNSDNKILPLEEKQNLTIDDTYPLFKNNQNFIDDYILKKLNYKG
jgi:hypothetical protein